LQRKRIAPLSANRLERRDRDAIGLRRGKREPVLEGSGDANRADRKFRKYFCPPRGDLKRMAAVHAGVHQKSVSVPYFRDWCCADQLMLHLGKPVCRWAWRTMK